MVVAALSDALVDSLKLLPFLFATYLFMEWLEHGAGERFERTIARTDKVAPVIGALLGVIPQCGFSGAAATLYAGRVISLGTLMSVFLVTSDEMLPIMISEAVDPALIAKVLAVKVVVGMGTGLALNAALDKLGRRHEGFASRGVHEGHAGNDIHHLCEAEGCDCAHGCESCSHALELEEQLEEAASDSHAHEHDHGHEHHHGHDHAHGGKVDLGHLAGAALRHSLQITVFIFVICFLLNLLVESGLEGAADAVMGMPYVSALVCAVLGLVPNCAVSVVFTQLYLEGMLSGGALMAGLLVNAGVGLIVLLRTNNDSRENLRIMAFMVVVGTVFGCLVEAIALL